MRREAEGAPAERSMRSMFDKSIEQEEKSIQRYEEDAMHRVNVTKDEKRKRKAKLREAMFDRERNTTDYKIMEEIVEMQAETVEKEKERQQQNKKLKEMMKTYKRKKKKTNN